jgi:hypothetical protein
MSRISPALRATYLATHYQVNTPDSSVLQIGRLSSELKSLHRIHHVDCSAFLTARNPLGQLTSLEQNQMAQRVLIAELIRRRIPALRRVGVVPCGEWPGEESYLALGMSRDEAIAMGKQYAQNAIV